MKKLFNNQPGGLKQKFEDETAIPSLKLWRSMEADIHALNNRTKKKKRRKALFLCSAAATVAILFGLSLFANMTKALTYSPRKAHVAQKNTYKSYTIEEKARQAKPDNLPQFLRNLNSSSDSFLNSSCSRLDLIQLADRENLSFEKMHTHNSKNAYDKFTIKPIRIEIGQNRLIASKLSTSPIPELKKHHQSPPSKWTINWYGGVDNTTNALAMKNASAFSASATPNSYVWFFGSYTHELPVNFNLSVERNIKQRLSAQLGLDVKRLEASSSAEPFKNHTAFKTGTMNHLGITLGLRYNLIDTKRISISTGAQLSLAHAGNAKTKVEEYFNDELQSVIITKSITPSSIVSGVGNFNASYKLNNHWSVGSSLLITKPLQNYIHELNVYNNGEDFIYGLRFGISFTI